MKIHQQPTLPLLVVVSLLAFLSHGMPQAGSITDDGPPISKRDDINNYVVYPKEPTNKDQATAIGNLLRDVVSDPKSISIHETDLGVDFWSVSLTTDNAKKVGADSNVAAIIQECTQDCPDPTGSDDPDAGTFKTKRFGGRVVDEERSLVKRDDGTVNSHKIDPEMVFISLPTRAELGDYEDFVYDKSAGTNIMVYIVDTGADLRNDDDFSKFVRTNVRWLHASGQTPQDTTENDIKGIGHGTGVLAKAAGWKHGTAKRSNPVMVRVNKLGDPAAWLNGVAKAYEDWRDNHYTGHETTATGILNLSWGWSRDSLVKAGYNLEQQLNWVTRMREYLNACVAIGLLPIAPSGNSPKLGPPNVAVNEYPQLFAYGDPADVPDMMVVGGIGTDGVLWPRSKVDPPNPTEVIKVYAPCYDITVPNAISGHYRAPAEVEGVSYASGTIAGLGTYFLGLPSLSSSLQDDVPTKRVQKLKEMLQRGSCIPRTDDDKICALYNLADPRTCPPDVPPDFKDGDEIGCKDTSSTSANTVVAIPGCFITTVSAMPSEGITAPQPECSCQGGEIAGIGSGTVSGTTYSWCYTGGLPPGVPPEATNPPAAVVTGSAPATPTTSSPASQQCVQDRPDAPDPAVTCSTSTKRNDVTTPLPDGNFACTNLCFCQINGEPFVCSTPRPEAKREVQPVRNGVLEPTAAPTLGVRGDYEWFKWL